MMNLLAIALPVLAGGTTHLADPPLSQDPDRFQVRVSFSLKLELGCKPARNSTAETLPDRSVAAARELVAMFVEKRFQALSERAAPEIASDSQPQDWESIAALVAEHFGDLEESAVEPEPAKEPHALDIVTVRLQFERAIAQIEITLDPEGRYHKLRVINLKAQPS